MAAMMADELSAEAMLDQPRRAIGTLEAMAAGATERQRRIAAPGEEEQGLLALPSRRPDRGDQTRRKPAPARRALAAQVDRLEIGHLARAEARGKLQPAVPALLGV